MTPTHPEVVVVPSAGDGPTHLLAKARVGLRKAGVHHRVIEEFTARALSGDRDQFDRVLAETVHMEETS